MKTVCPHCHQKYDVPEDFQQQNVLCQKCGGEFTVNRAKFCSSCGAANPAQAFQCHACSHPFQWEASRPVERALPVRPVSAVTDRSEVELSPGLKILFFFAKLGCYFAMIAGVLRALSAVIGEFIHEDRGIIIICSIISVLLNEWFVLILTVLANPERKVRKSLFFLLGFWVYGIYLLAMIIFSFLMSSGFTWIGAVLINLLYLLFLVKVFQIWKERCLIDQDYEPSER